jgi:hypothetical protein
MFVMESGPLKLLRLGAYALFMAALFTARLPAALADQGGQPAAAQPGAPGRPGLPVLPVLGGNRVLYVIAIGADYSARSKVIASLAERLEKYHLRNDPWIFAEADWTVGDYINQCVANPQSTEGAILLSIAATAAGTFNKFFYSENWFHLDSDAAFITCDATASGKTTYGISWASGVQIGSATKNTYAQLFSAAALIFSAASTISTFIPSHTVTTTTTMVFPTPRPIPPGGQTTGQTTTISKTSNPASLANSSAALLAPALAFAPSTAQTPIVDGMTWLAAESVVDSLVKRMNCAPLQGAPNAKSIPYSPAPFCAQPQPQTP